MASNSGYNNIPQNIRAQMVQSINQSFQGPEAVSMLQLFDLLFANLGKHANSAGANNTGWSAMGGTGSRSSISAAAAGTASGTYVSTELQGALNRIAALEARLKSLDNALFSAGIIKS